MSSREVQYKYCEKSGSGADKNNSVDLFIMMK